MKVHHACCHETNIDRLAITHLARLFAADLLICRNRSSQRWQQPAMAAASITRSSVPASNEAIVFAMQHAALSTDPQILCAAACTCKSWSAAAQQAAQQCGTSHMVIALDLTAPLDTTSSFVGWLSKHAAIVDRITANVERNEHEVYEDLLYRQSQHPEIAAAWNCVYSACQQAALAQQQQQQQQQQLCLCSFSSNWVLDARIVETLPAGSLTQLDLELPFDLLYYPKQLPKVDGPALSSALAQLSNLQQLRLAGSSPSMALPTTCLPGITQLSRLTTLRLEGSWEGPDSGDALRARPNHACVTDALKQLLQHALPLRQLHLGFSVGCQPSELSLAALTELTHLHIGFPVLGLSLLPPQLLQLDWGKCAPHDVAGVQQLQQLKLHVAFGHVLPLLRLTQLRALTELVLTYDNAEHVFSTRAAWQQLPQLRELDMSRVVQPCEQQWGAIRRAAAACTGLTRLELGVPTFGNDAETDLEETTAEESDE
jgi:hypothetical protein